mmetsp:Transcript_104467/g.322305  ORF Transcript_104467/g.322305 Transcript_104467/m.322305 type:complete len:316 (+) Transcript_104467:76-1023(+)
MSVAASLDTSGVAVITGGASGFGLEVALRLAGRGMRLAILDVSAKELEAAEPKLRAAGSDGVLCMHCDVTKFENCEVAQRKVSEGFSGVPVSFLFNNAGILGKEGGKIMKGSHAAWAPIFNVNVLGAMHVIKAFLPAMVKAGPLPSGKSTFVVTTSSVVGLLHTSLGPYSVSKMAVTALCEQLSLELQEMGSKAAHISPHSLHPTVAGTGFLEGRDADGSKNIPAQVKDFMLEKGIPTAASIVDGLFRGLDEGRSYIIVDHELDVPSAKQIAVRMEDQMLSRRPTKPEQLGFMLLMAGDLEAFKKRQEALQRSRL